MTKFNSSIPIKAHSASRAIDFIWIDWIVIVAYLAAVFGLSIFFALQRKAKAKGSTKTYFAGDGKVPSWVVGFSIWATILSTITYLGTPANAYEFGWVYAFAQLTMLVMAPFILKKIIPFFKIMTQDSVYSYLEARFSRGTRLVTSSLFIFFNIFRVGIILYMTTLAISFVIPIDTVWLMVIMGVFVIITTLLGGMKGILWSDAIQGIIRLILILIIIIYCLVNIDFSEGYKPAIFLNASSFNISLVSAGIPLVFFANIIITLYSYVGSQDVVRRYKAIENPRKIASSIWFVGFLSILSIFIFYGTGSALYSFYGGTPATQIAPEIVASNQIIPYFAFTVLPIGLGALLIASIFTASQTNISSGLTSIVNAIFSDFILQKYKLESKKMLLLTQALLVIFGIFGSGLGIALLYIDINDIIVYFLGIMSLFGAAPVATFILAIFTKRTSAFAALVSLILGLSLALGLWFISQKIFLDVVLINSLWIAIFSFVLTLGLGYLLSFVWPNKKDITNLCWPAVNSDFKTYFKLEKQLYSKKKISKEQLQEIEKEYQIYKQKLFFK